jgi:hypothetical protein
MKKSYEYICGEAGDAQRPLKLVLLHQKGISADQTLITCPQLVSLGLFLAIVTRYRIGAHNCAIEGVGWYHFRA